MNCPLCSLAVVYKNQDYVSHGYYCTDSKCMGWIKCDQWCCTLEICPRCFGSGNWPWVQWGGPMVCSACDGKGKINALVHSRLKNTPEDRRDPNCPPRPGMIWSEKHKMWADRDTRSPEQKKKDDQLAIDTLERWKKEGKI